ncbi:MAG TPA: phosphatase PAP2 family protein [Gemmataceae bacterium]|nr:phosphatase PAP2 family protein [Gemmataceae bacterium]
MRVLSFNATMTAIAAGVLALSAWGMHAARITLPASQVVPRLALLGVLLAGVAFYRWRKVERALNLVLMTFWAVLISNLLLLSMYVAARLSAQPCDAQLARIDAWLGVEVPDVLRLMEQVPAVGRVLEVCYGTLIFLMTLAIMVPPLCGRMASAKEFALSSVAAAAISLPLFAAFPALGPWSYYGYAPSSPQAESMQVLLALKGDDGFVLDLSDLNGVICLPSFHTILAVLSATALWSIPYLRWAAAALAVLIVLSTVATGWHYLVDVMAGLLVAPASVAAARGYLWLISD